MNHFFLKITLISSLVISSFAYGSNKCRETDLKGLQYIAQTDVSKFWVPENRSKRIRFGKKIERAISKGRVGFVIANQTINEEGNVSDLEIVKSYPDDFFIEPAVKAAKAIKYRATTCRVVPVRYQTIHTFTSKESDYKKLLEMYENSKKDL